MKRFKKDSVPDLPFQLAKKKPIPMRVCQIMEDFEVESIEGVMQAKAGDYLVVGFHGEMWPIKKEIFEDTYEFIVES
jgi:hypothetical protein